MHHVIDRLRCRLALSSAAIALCVAAVMPAAPVRAEGVPAALRGTWSLDCADPNAAQLVLEAANVTLVTAGRRHAYAGVEVSYTWVGGARASGDRVWLLISKAPNGPFAFVIATTRGKRPVLVLEEGHPEHGREARRLFGAKFLRCTGAPAQSDRSDAPAAGADKRAALDVEVMEEGGDGQAANCMSSVVAGLKPGGTLAVRSGPGTHHRKIDELHNDEVVIIFAMRGEWAGIVYRTRDVDCSARETIPVPYERKGWIHTRWLRLLAG